MTRQQQFLDALITATASGKLRWREEECPMSGATFSFRGVSCFRKSRSRGFEYYVTLYEWSKEVVRISSLDHPDVERLYSLLSASGRDVADIAIENMMSQLSAL